MAFFAALNNKASLPTTMPMFSNKREALQCIKKAPSLPTQSPRFMNTNPRSIQAYPLTLFMLVLFRAIDFPKCRGSDKVRLWVVWMPQHSTGKQQGSSELTRVWFGALNKISLHYRLHPWPCLVGRRRDSDSTQQKTALQHSISLLSDCPDL